MRKVEGGRMRREGGGRERERVVYLSLPCSLLVASCYTLHYMAGTAHQYIPWWW